MNEVGHVKEVILFTIIPYVIHEHLFPVTFTSEASNIDP